MMQLPDALLQYFEFNIWKKTMGLTKQSPFDAWSEDEVRKVIYALETVGILEKRGGANTTSAVYRLKSVNVEWWKNRLNQILEARKLPSVMTFRMLYVLYVIGNFYLQYNRPPKQTELLNDHKTKKRGLINQWLEDSGAVREDPHMLNSAVQLRNITLELADLGYMIERGNQQARQPYLLTPKGVALVQELQGLHWSQWLSLW